MLFPLSYSIGLVLGYIVLPSSIQTQGDKHVYIGDSVRVWDDRIPSGSVVSIDASHSGGILTFPEIELNDINTFLRVFIGDKKTFEWEFADYSIPIVESTNLLKYINNTKSKSNNKIDDFAVNLGNTRSENLNHMTTRFSLPVEIQHLDVDRLYTRRLEVVAPASEDEITLVFGDTESSAIPSPQNLTADTYYIVPYSTSSAYLSLEGSGRINFQSSGRNSSLSYENRNICIDDSMCFNSEGITVTKTNILSGSLTLGKTVISDEGVYIPDDYIIDESVGGVLMLGNLNVKGMLYLGSSSISSDANECNIISSSRETNQFILSNNETDVENANFVPFRGPKLGEMIISDNFRMYSIEEDFNISATNIEIGTGYSFEFDADIVNIGDQLELLDGLILNSFVEIGTTIKQLTASSNVFKYNFIGNLRFTNPESKIAATYRSYGTSVIINGTELSGPNNIFSLADGALSDELETQKDYAQVIIDSPMAIFNISRFNGGVLIEDKFLINDSINSNDLPLVIESSVLDLSGNIIIGVSEGSIAFESTNSDNTIMFRTSETINIEVPIVSPSMITIDSEVSIGDKIKIIRNTLEYSDVLILGSENIGVEVVDSDEGSKYNDLSIRTLLVEDFVMLEENRFYGPKIKILSSAPSGVVINGFNFYDEFKMEENTITADDISLGSGYDELSINALKFGNTIIFNNIVYSETGISFGGDNFDGMKIGSISINKNQIIVEDSLVIKNLKILEYTLSSNIEITNTFNPTELQGRNRESNILLTDLSLNNPEQDLIISSEQETGKHVIVVENNLIIPEVVNYENSKFGYNTSVDIFNIHNNIMISNNSQQNQALYGLVIKQASENSNNDSDNDENVIAIGDFIKAKHLYLGDAFTNSFTFNELKITLNDEYQNGIKYNGISFKNGMVDLQSTLMIEKEIGESPVNLLFREILEDVIYVSMNSNINTIDFKHILITNLEVNDIVTKKASLFIYDQESENMSFDLVSQEVFTNITMDVSGGVNNINFEIHNTNQENVEKIMDFFDPLMVIGEVMNVSIPITVGGILFEETEGDYIIKEINSGYINVSDVNIINEENKLYLKKNDSQQEEIIILTDNSIEANNLAFLNISVIGNNFEVSNDIVLAESEDYPELLTVTGDRIHFDAFSIIEEKIEPTHIMICSDIDSQLGGDICKVLEFNVKVKISGEVTGHDFVVKENEEGNVEGFEFDTYTLRAKNLVEFVNSINDDIGIVNMNSVQAIFEANELYFSNKRGNGETTIKLLEENYHAKFGSIYATSFELPQIIEIGSMTINLVEDKTSQNKGIEIIQSFEDGCSQIQEGNKLYLNSESTEPVTLEIASPLILNNYVKFGEKVSFIQNEVDTNGYIHISGDTVFLEENFIKFTVLSPDEIGSTTSQSELSWFSIGDEKNVIMDISDFDDPSSQISMSENLYFKPKEFSQKV